VPPDDGLNTDDLEHTAQEEIDAHLTRLWRNRGPLYAISAISIMLDNRPDFAKLHRRGASLFGRPEPVDELVGGLGNLFAYIHMGFEVGIFNEVRNRQRQGVSKAQFMELVMLAQLSAGIRGLQVVYNAVGQLLPGFQDRSTPAVFPDGWAPDPDASRCGLDLTTRELTPADVQNLNAWYTNTLGEVPAYVSFAAQQHPRFLKAVRAKWEAAFRGALPKQLIPYLMLRHNTMFGVRDGIREAALLGKAWGLSREWVVKGTTQSAYYFGGLGVLNVVDEAIGDILVAWD
jgi:hypothetical protein